ncbi:MAG: hypothetical protein JST83_07560 [Bacteroidetes bacterium]|nr:hypothetical protein [Bacteroidota bacterium]
MKPNTLLLLFILLLAGTIWLKVTWLPHGQEMPAQDKSTARASDDGRLSGTVDNYPDLTFVLAYDTPPSDTCKHIIDAYGQVYARKYSAWVSALALDTASGHYIIGCDYQATPYREAMIHELADSLFARSGVGLRHIRIE